ncbi:hypothetical protein JOB18_010231 [Solea senegalensis]|uniref:Uncharacterized protein n=1 Tax=Solea senegalensis TaxID=28829 RepID=A0AAV6T4F7_SOLSE|nr:hypothetical protein JOB18_010231 [Solea senegalensis]
MEIGHCEVGELSGATLFFKKAVKVYLFLAHICMFHAFGTGRSAFDIKMGCSQISHHWNPWNNGSHCRGCGAAGRINDNNLSLDMKNNNNKKSQDNCLFQKSIQCATPPAHRQHRNGESQNKNQDNKVTWSSAKRQGLSFIGTGVSGGSARAAAKVETTDILHNPMLQNLIVREKSFPASNSALAATQVFHGPEGTPGVLA